MERFSDKTTPLIYPSGNFVVDSREHNKQDKVDFKQITDGNKNV